MLLSTFENNKFPTLKTGISVTLAIILNKVQFQYILQCCQSRKDCMSRMNDLAGSKSEWISENLCGHLYYWLYWLMLRVLINCIIIWALSHDSLWFLMVWDLNIITAMLLYRFSQSTYCKCDKFICLEFSFLNLLRLWNLIYGEQLWFNKHFWAAAKINYTSCTTSWEPGIPKKLWYRISIRPKWLSLKFLSFKMSYWHI